MKLLDEKEATMTEETITELPDDPIVTDTLEAAVNFLVACDPRRFGDDLDRASMQVTALVSISCALSRLTAGMAVNLGVMQEVIDDLLQDEGFVSLHEEALLQRLDDREAS